MPGYSHCLLRWLAGCAVGPNYHAPQTPTPEKFIAACLFARPTPGAAAVDLAQWWRALEDPELDALIDRAIKAKPDIEIALTRLQEARTRQAALVSDALPEAGAAGAAGRGTGSDLARGRAPPALASADNTAAVGQIREVVGFDANWDIDLFGKYRREVEAARYDTQAAAWARNAVLVTVVANVARSYVDLRGLQMRLAIARQDIASAQQFRDIVQTRFDRGITNELDLTLANRELATLQSDVAPLQRAGQRDGTHWRCSWASIPKALTAELAKPGLIPAIPEQIEPGAAARASQAPARHSGG